MASSDPRTQGPSLPQPCASCARGASAEVVISLTDAGVNSRSALITLQQSSERGPLSREIMASLLAPVLSLLRRPRPGSAETTPAAPLPSPAAPLPSLPLELAGPFYDTATLVAVTLTTKGCAASKMLSVQWAGVLSRRFPCLAALPAFQAPLADAKAVVKGLLTATPPPPEPPRRGRSRGGGSLLPSAPRDGEGRALPLRDTVIIAAQLSVRGDTALTHRPLLFGHRRMADVIDPTDGGAFGAPCWHIDIPLAAVGDGSRQMKTCGFEQFCRVHATRVARELGVEESHGDVRSALHDAWIDLGSDGRLSFKAACCSGVGDSNLPTPEKVITDVFPGVSKTTSFSPLMSVTDKIPDLCTTVVLP